jgi:hypothetical protein
MPFLSRCTSSLRRSVIAVWLVLVLGIAPLLPSVVHAQPAELIDLFPTLRFSQITDIQGAPDGSSRVFVVQKGGVIDVFDEMASAAAITFLDLSSVVNTNGEGGLVGLAFHPDYATNGRFFVYYTTTDNGDFVSRISEFSVSSDPDRADLSSETIRLQLVQPGIYHNSGQLQFGPDGYLYVAFGDGIAAFEDDAGGVADPFNHGQDPTTLFSSMVRMDIDGGGNAPDCGGAGTNESANYGIPADNPFVGDASACDEIYAYGFRNPFRFSFDETGRLWLADVGEQQREEIHWVEAGNNYGWKTIEGSVCFDPATGCDATGLELPVWEYAHPPEGGGRSITGGYVIPNGGCAFTEGTYVFGDFVTGEIWNLDPSNAPFQSSDLLIDSDLMISTFGLAPSGQLLVGDYSGGALYGFDCSTLPVELAGFRGDAVGDRAALRWTTLSETTNAGFDVLHRAPGTDTWAHMAFVDGAGTTTSPVDYRFDTPPLPAGVHAFRLRQVDVDGTGTLGPVIDVTIRPDAPLALSAPQPHPVIGRSTVTLITRATEHVTVQLYDVLGRNVGLVFDDVVSADRPATLDLSAQRLASGIYFLRAATASTSYTTKVVVQ